MPDGSVLVHQKVGREPVNWQPPDTRIRYQTENDNSTPVFVIYSYRLKPPEKMYVRFKTIDMISTHRLRNDQTLQITGAGSDMADRIMSDPSVIEEGLRITGRENGHDPEQSTSTVLTETTHRASSRSNEASPHHPQCYNSTYTSSTTNTDTPSLHGFTAYCTHPTYQS